MVDEVLLEQVRLFRHGQHATRTCVLVLMLDNMICQRESLLHLVSTLRTCLPAQKLTRGTDIVRRDHHVQLPQNRLDRTADQGIRLVTHQSEATNLHLTLRTDIHDRLIALVCLIEKKDLQDGTMNRGLTRERLMRREGTTIET